MADVGIKGAEGEMRGPGACPGPCGSTEFPTGRADKSAVGTVNRPLHLFDDL